MSNLSELINRGSIAGRMPVVKIDHTAINLIAERKYILDMGAASGDISLNLPAGPGAEYAVLEVSVINNADNGWMPTFVGNIRFDGDDYTGISMVIPESWVKFSWDFNQSKWVLDCPAQTIAGTLYGALEVTGALTAKGNTSLDGGSFVFNESGADKDFRVEGDTNANLLFCDASTDRVGVGTNSPQTPLQVTGSISSYAYSYTGNASSWTTDIAINTVPGPTAGAIGSLVMVSGSNSGGNAFTKVYVIAVKPNGGTGDDVYSVSIASLGVGPVITFDNNSGFLRINWNVYMAGHISIYR